MSVSSALVLGAVDSCLSAWHHSRTASPLSLCSHNQRTGTRPPACTGQAENIDIILVARSTLKLDVFLNVQ
jgi:hypothetical protein